MRGMGRGQMSAFILAALLLAGFFAGAGPSQAAVANREVASKRTETADTRIPNHYTGARKRWGRGTARNTAGLFRGRAERELHSGGARDQPQHGRKTPSRDRGADRSPARLLLRRALHCSPPEHPTRSPQLSGLSKFTAFLPHIGAARPPGESRRSTGILGESMADGQSRSKGEIT